MSNCDISFVTKRSLVAGVLAGDEVTLHVELTQFDRKPDVNKKTNITLSNRRSSSLFFIGNSWSVSATESGTVKLPNVSEVPLATEHWTMFFESVANNEEFTITNLDDGDAEMVVKLSSDWGYARRSAAYVDEFTYSFTVSRED